MPKMIARLKLPKSSIPLKFECSLDIDVTPQVFEMALQIEIALQETIAPQNV
jgi:hypothetical protein